MAAKTQLLVTALACSLGLNLYGASYLLGHHTRQHVAATAIARKQIDSLLGTLPHDRQASIRKGMSDDVELLKQQMKDARQGHEQLAHLLTAPTLDTAAINAEFAQLRLDTTQSQEHVQHMVLDAFEQMTQEERERAVEHLSTPEKK